MTDENSLFGLDRGSMEPITMDKIIENLETLKKKLQTKDMPTIRQRIIVSYAQFNRWIELGIIDKEGNIIT